MNRNKWRAIASDGNCVHVYVVLDVRCENDKIYTR